MSIPPVSSSNSYQAITQASLDSANLSTLSILSAATAQATQQVNLNAVVSYQSTPLYGSGLDANQFSIQSSIINTYLQISKDTQELVDKLKADAQQAAADLADMNILGFLGDVVQGVVNIGDGLAKTLTNAISGLFTIVVGLMSLFLGFSSWRLADLQLQSSELIGGPNAALTIITDENSLNNLIPYVNPGKAFSKINNISTAKADALTGKLSAENLAQTNDAEKNLATVSASAQAESLSAASERAASVQAQSLSSASAQAAASAQRASSTRVTNETSAIPADQRQPRSAPLPSPYSPRADAPSISQLHSDAESSSSSITQSKIVTTNGQEKAQAISHVNDLEQIASLEKHHLFAEAQQTRLALSSIRNHARATNPGGSTAS